MPGLDHGDFIGNTLESVDEASIAHIPGIRAVVVIRDFVGVVAEREEQAEHGHAQRLAVQWKPLARHAATGRPGRNALRDNPSTPRQLVDEGDVERRPGRRQCRCWTEPMCGRTRCTPPSAPSCAVADWHGEAATPAP
jgi:nicotinate dehydrogenase subunit B